ncbi:MAG: 50S ribosomal protein L10 [Saprospiraceae bacterium]|jgi:large subunit ribosomal protein L10|nr:50S ribosomal protein L10 [Saprospiraceae bacterium]MBK6477183.1 50S ribosomal protein L10 [Saprospiraceae bacterium]MBK6814516.1 50S ribosomal protein L10 [Saprospiraceae bacterium]MBK7369903.1 50S ribosomal protein L10 [Saprospiraceae bacterium]MBK7437606.1 50S ribosomal protein L10 [Saprospiraceae bacterium]
MNKTEKGATIEALKDKINESSFFYLADASSMTVAQINSFRRICHEKGIEVKVVKNTLARKAMEALPADKGYADLYEALHGPTAMLFADAGNAPAKVIKDFRATSERPILKAAYIDSAVFLGDDQLDVLIAIKSKNELIGEIISLLQSPAKNVIGALQSGGHKLAGLVKALEERAN